MARDQADVTTAVQSSTVGVRGVREPGLEARAGRERCGMEPVIIAAVVTVTVSVVNAIVKIAQRRLTVSVERVRISEAAQTERVRFLTGRAAILAPHCDGRESEPAGGSWGGDRGRRR